MKNLTMLDRNLRKFTRICTSLKHACMYKTTITNQLCDIRKFSTSSKLFCNTEEELKRRPMMPKLMNTRLYIYFRPFAIYKCFIMAFLIRLKYSNAFRITEIVKGATQAMLHVSGCLSKGELEQLKGIIEPKALEEIKRNFPKLTRKQRHFLLVNKEDLIRKFVYELTITKDRDTGKEYAEAVVVFQGFHGFAEFKHKKSSGLLDNRYEPFHKKPYDIYVCNYKFVKELTKDLEKDWIIHELNHFPYADHRL